MEPPELPLEWVDKIPYALAMTLRKILFLFTLVAILAFLPMQVKAQNVNFIKIIDGDSLLVEAGGRSLEVRLIGVDAPEFRQEYGREAKEFSLRFCFGQKLRLEFDKDLLDRYGRVLAYVYKGDEMLNQAIIKAGLAIAVNVKPNSRYYSRFKATEKQARKNKHGFWLKGGLDMTPAQWRRKNKKRK
ncbi:thermonuclease family protein [Pseudodesulfovibrio sediminis]|uniref:TNase-like domain-containing protein n=1 Tax=Pseudodesulfovibrio sediminis TaxID=2810563 RepID=A0ABN6EU20_9BACT|nr:thermonuclease family protein [Pseudodesulfovibrio sediminis]BCS88937.1 hypothetical protein PSDVSF_21790 [Pseudodesulfovibrio sediminis]